jgi:hypothetical protein
MTATAFTTRNVCEQHTAYLFDKGGLTRIIELGPMVSCQWQRIRDDVSKAQIVLASPECALSIDQVEAGRHELVIYRGSQRVWEGPITLVVFERGQVTIEARDVMHYVYRAIMRRAYNNAYPNIVTCVNRARNILTLELPRFEALNPPINVLPFLTTWHHPDDARTSRSTIAFQKTAFEDIDDMAAKSGIDYTVLGRAIHIHDTHVPLGRTAPLTEADIVGDVIVTQYGMEMATFAAVTGGNGMYGYAAATGASAQGVHPYYGLWEILDDAYDEDEGGEIPTQNELNSQAKRNVSGRIPTPITVRIPDGSTLSPGSPVQLDDLVPGVQVPLLATLTGRRFSQMQKLDRVDIVENSDGEEIRITLSPESENAIDPEQSLGVTRTVGGDDE